MNLEGFWQLSSRLLLFFTIPALIGASLLTSVFVDAFLASGVGLFVFVAYGASNFVWFQMSESLAALGRIRDAAAISAFGSIVLGLVVLGLSLFFDPSVPAVVAAYVVGFLVQICVAAPRIRREMSGAEPQGVRLLLATGPRMLGYHFGQDLVFRLDRYLLGAVSTTEQVGFYAVATTPAELVRIPVNAAAQFTLLDAARGAVNSFREVAFRALKWTGIAAFAVALVLPFASFLIEFVYGSEYAGAALPFQILLIAQVCLVPHLVMSRALVGAGGMLSTSLAGLSGLVVLVVVGLSLMPASGAPGAALACAAAYLAMSATSCVSLYRHYRGPS